MPLHRAIKEQGSENFIFEVFKTVEYIDTYHLLIMESCCMDEMIALPTDITQNTAFAWLIYIRLFIYIILYCSLKK